MLSSPSTFLGEALGLHPTQRPLLVPSWSLGKPGSLASPPPILEKRVSPPPPIFGSATAGYFSLPASPRKKSRVSSSKHAHPLQESRSAAWGSWRWTSWCSEGLVRVSRLPPLHESASLVAKDSPRCPSGDLRAQNPKKASKCLQGQKLGHQSP